MVSAFKNIFKIPELKRRIIFTLVMLAVLRIGAAITLPGVDPAVVQLWLSDASNKTGGFGQLLNMFSGGAMQQCAILGLGIMPYISASIMVQLGSAVIPSLSKVAKEVGGRQKLSQFTRYLTILLCLVQGTMIAKGIANPVEHSIFGPLGDFLTKQGLDLTPGEGSPGFGFYALVVLVLTAGTMFTMWLGEQITERGIGNGTSLIISVNIMQDMPRAISAIWYQFMGRENTTAADPLKLVGYIILFLVVTVAIIAISQAVRKVPVTYAKRLIGRKQMGGQNTNLPLKINYAGVMPIIFASALCMFIPMIASFFGGNSAFANKVNNIFMSNEGQGPIIWIIYLVLIFFFAFFWVAIMFQPTSISEEMKSQGGYIPGIRPGKPTADFLDFTMTRLTTAGAVFLSMVAIGPMIIGYFGSIPQVVTQFFGGTSVLILVGVLLDIMRQVETHLIQQNYDGFVKKGKSEAKYDGAGNARQDDAKMVWLYALLGLLFLVAAYNYLRPLLFGK